MISLSNIFPLNELFPYLLQGEQLIVTFAAGYIAGVFCAIVSHPADSIVSYMNKAKGATIGSAAKALGFKGCWQGLGPRIIMIGTLTALQWFIYDGVKVALALPRYDVLVKMSILNLLKLSKQDIPTNGSLFPGLLRPRCPRALRRSWPCNRAKEPLQRKYPSSFLCTSIRTISTSSSKTQGTRYNCNMYSIRKQSSTDDPIMKT